jgi:hypothetical protein
MEWVKVQALSSNPRTAKKKKERKKRILEAATRGVYKGGSREGKVRVRNES